MQEVTLSTPEGDMRAFTFHPAGQGPWPPVIFFMDGPGIRPALFEMGERLASHGYYVVLPDMFWRLGPYQPVDMKDPAQRESAPWRAGIATSGPEKQMGDTRACLDFLDRQPEARPGKVGTTGYCMGAGIALRAAAAFPDRVAAVGAFHGGRLVTDDPDSPHRLAPKIRAKVYCAGGDEDAMFTADDAKALKAALDAAGVANEVTIYKGAHHGYAPPDMPAYHREASERHWTELLKLLDETLKAT